jgi:phage terminase small subunit
MSKPKLNERRKRFVYYYLKELNATEAAKKAGFSEKYAANIGSRLLKKESIKVHIDKRLSEAFGAEKAGLKQRIINELESEAFAESVYYDETKGGTVTRPNASKMKALELLAKYLGMLVEKHEHTGKDGAPIEYIKLPETAKE